MSGSVLVCPLRLGSYAPYPPLRPVLPCAALPYPPAYYYRAASPHPSQPYVTVRHSFAT